MKRNITTLYIVHGWAYSIEPWQPTLNYLKDMNITPIILHVPGLTEPSNKVWNINDYKEWLHKELQGAKDPIVLGHSNGGRILLNYSIEYPDSIKHIILLNSAGVYENPHKISNKRLLLRKAAKVAKPFKYIPGIRKVLYRAVGASDYERAPENMKLTLQNMLDSDMQLHPENITAPTSILWGSGDVMTPVEQAHVLHKLINHSSLKIINGWGHAPYRTHPEQLAAEIREIVEHI